MANTGATDPGTGVIYRIGVQFDDKDANAKYEQFKKKLNAGKLSLKFSITGLTPKAMANLKAVEPILDKLMPYSGKPINVNVIFKVPNPKQIDALRTVPLVLKQVTPYLKSWEGKTLAINVQFKVPTAAQITNLRELPPILQQMRAAIGNKPLIIQVDVRGTASAKRALGQVQSDVVQTNAVLDRMRSSMARTFSRIEFLATAFIANFVTEILTRSIQEAAKVEGAMAGMEMSFTRVGVSGRQFANIMRDADATNAHYRFGIAQTTDALNKLVVGGLRPTEEQLKRMKDISVGASVLFGESPDKMFNDLATAALRVSYRIADNLGIIIRPMEAYAKFAAKNNLDPKMLTGQQKSKAFFEAMLNAPGAELLIKAGELDSRLKTLQQMNVTMEQFKLTFGEALLDGVMPFGKGLADLDTQTMRNIVNITLLIAKVGILAAGLSALRGALAISRSYLFAPATAESAGGLFAQQKTWRAGQPAGGNAFQRAGRYGSSPIGGMIATAASTAALVVATAALDNYNTRLARLSQLQRDATLDGARFEAFLASINIQFNKIATDSPATIAAIGDLRSLGDVGTIAAGTAEKTANFSTELSAMVKELGLSDDASKDLQRSITSLQSEGIQKFRDAVVDAAKGNKDFTGSEEQISRIARQTLMPSLADTVTQIGLVRAEQARQTIEGVTNWDKFSSAVITGGAGVLDALAQVSMGTANIVYMAFVGLSSLIAGAVHGALGLVETYMNGVIDSWNKFANLMNTSKPVMVGLLNSMGPVGAGFGALLNHTANLPTLGHVELTKGGVDAMKGVWDITGGDKAWQNLGALGGGGTHWADSDGTSFGFGLLDKLANRKDQALNGTQGSTLDILRQLRSTGFLASPPPETLPDPKGKTKKPKQPTTAEQLGLQPDQYKNLMTIINTGASMGITDEKVLQSAIATAIVESKLHNLKGGDRDSVGVFQQRPSQGWGSRAKILGSVEYQAQQYFQHALGGRAWNGKRFDIDTIGMGALAQAVQGSGFPDKYENWMGHGMGKGQTTAQVSKRLLEGVLGQGDTNFAEPKENPFQALYDKFIDTLKINREGMGLEMTMQKLTGEQDLGAIAQMYNKSAKDRLEMLAHAQADPDYAAFLKTQGVDMDMQFRTARFERGMGVALDMKEEQGKLMEGYRAESEERRRVNEVLSQYGIKIDAGKELQDTYNEAVKIITDKTLTAAQRNALLNEDPKFRKALDDVTGMLQRQAQYDYQSGEMNFQTLLAQAKEVDPNRDRAIGFMGDVSQAQLLVQRAISATPGTEEATTIFKELRDAELQLFNDIKGIQKYVTPEGQNKINEVVNSLVPQVEEAAKRLDPGPTLFNNLQLAGGTMVEAGNIGAANIVGATAAYAGILNAAGQALAAAHGVTGAAVSGFTPTTSIATASPSTWTPSVGKMLDLGTGASWTGTVGGAGDPWTSASGPGGGGVQLPSSPAGLVYTQDQMEAMGKKPPPPEQQFNYQQVVNNWIGGVLGQSNVGSLGSNLLSGLPGLAGQLTQNPLIGGLLQFAMNSFGGDQALSSKDDEPADVRIVEDLTKGIEYSSVRDRDELLYAKSQRQRNETWSMYASSQRGN